MPCLVDIPERLEGNRREVDGGGGVGTERRGQRDNCGQDVSYERIKMQEFKPGVSKTSNVLIIVSRRGVLYL